MVEVALEDDQVGFGEVEEEVRSFGVEIPVGESGTPEGVLFVDLVLCVSVEGAYWFDRRDLPRHRAFRIPKR